MSQALFLNTGKETIKGGALHALKDAGNAGAFDFATLAITTGVADTDTFTLGNDVYEIHLVGTDSGSNANANIEIGDNGFTVDVAPTRAFARDEVLRVGSEFMIVQTVSSDGLSVTVLRGQFGSTEAQHTTTPSIFQAAQLVTAGRFAVPVSATAIATSRAQVVAAVQFWTGPNENSPSEGGYEKGLGGGIGVRVQNSLKVDAFAGAGAGDVIFAYPANGDVAATAEAMATSTLSVFANGVEPASQKASRIYVVAADTADLSFVAPFPVTAVYADVFDVSTGQPLAFNGSTSITSSRLVTIVNGTVAGEWQAGDVIEVTLLG